MYGQFFGSYLLNKRAVTPAQLITAISDVEKSHIKLGTLAMFKGYMTSDEVDECCYLQRREDKRFGEIAIERHYLFHDQLDDLLESQIPEYLRLGQVLVDAGVLTNAQFHDLMVGYNEDHFDKDEEPDSDTTHAKSLSMVKSFFESFGREVDEYTLVYYNLMFNNLVRFIGDDFTPLEPVAIDEYQTNYCVLQRIEGEYNLTVRLDLEESVAISFASRYAEMEFDDFNDYVAASLEDFLNLHNGLFCVNISNTFSKDFTLGITEKEEAIDIELPSETIALPIIYPFGTIYIIVSHGDV